MKQAEVNFLRLRFRTDQKRNIYNSNLPRKPRSTEICQDLYTRLAKYNARDSSRRKGKWYGNALNSRECIFDPRAQRSECGGMFTLQKS